MKILVIPDVHGRTFWKKAIEIIDKVDKVIFLGDYLDPYSMYENISFKDALDNFKEIIKFKNKYSEKVVTLLGNHDCHYIFNNIEPCWRYNKKHAKQAKELYDTINLLLIYIQDGYLFSHAGVTEEWLNCCNLSLQDLTNKPVKELVHYLWMVGPERGGHQYGSCIWCDVREFTSLSPNLGYNQVFGHTQMIAPFIQPNFCCLDTKQCFIIDTSINIKTI